MAEEKIDKKTKEEIIEDIHEKGVTKEIAEKEEKIAEKTEEEKPIAETKEEKKEIKEKPKKEVEKESVKKKEPAKGPKKTEAIVFANNLPISTKQSSAICKFIKGKEIQIAIKNLEEVLKLKRSIPMKGEIPHRKDSGKIASGSGRYPQKACQNFIKLLKSLQANANVNGLENPIVVEAISNLSSRPYGRFGSVRKKRTNVKIKAKEKKLKEKTGKKKK